MIKNTAKFLAAIIFYYSGLIWLWMILIKRRNARPPILMYHRVLDKDDGQARFTQQSLIVSKAAFKAQMAFLKRKFNIITLSELADLLAANGSLPKRALVITFDDGWRDNYANAFPVLRENQIAATIFLTVDYIESARILWFSRLGRILASEKMDSEKVTKVFTSITGEKIDGYPGDSAFLELLKKYKPNVINEIIDKLETACQISMPAPAGEMLTWNEIALMRDGGIEFGSHGLSHSIMTLLDEREINEELCRSKTILENKLGAKVTSYAYPNGNNNEMIRRLAQEAGYKCAVATGPGSSPTNGDDPYALRRVGIHDDMSAGPLGGFSKSLLMFHISGLYDRINRAIG